MNKFNFLILFLLTLFNLNCIIDNNIFLDPDFDYDLNKFVEIEYSAQDDYYILKGKMNEHKVIGYNISYVGDVVAYYLFTNNNYNKEDLVTMDIPEVFTKANIKTKSKRRSEYHTFTAEYSGDYFEYCYTAIHIPYFSENQVSPYIKTDFGLTMGQTLLYILIVIGVIVGLAIISMVVAGLMGRNPLEGLAIFLIICICCCHKR